jgi:hypothetical protein
MSTKFIYLKTRHLAVKVNLALISLSSSYCRLIYSDSLDIFIIAKFAIKEELCFKVAIYSMYKLISSEMYKKSGVKLRSLNDFDFVYTLV